MREFEQNKKSIKLCGGVYVDEACILAVNGRGVP